MPEALFEDLPILADLGASLREGMARAEATVGPAAVASPRRRRPRFGWLGSFMVLGLVGTAAAAGTLTLLRGSPIPGPKAEDTQASMSPRSGSLNVLDLRAADPDGGHLPFALRIGESEAGQACATVGQVEGNDFGIVGEDGRFRELAPGIVDGCGDHAPGDATITGARIFDAKRWDDVRTVVYGVASDVESAELVARGRPTSLPLSGGAFLAVVRGYPEDSKLSLRLRFRSGQERRYPLGIAPRAILDPAGPAWAVNLIGRADGPGEMDRLCAQLAPVRPSRASFDLSPAPPLCSPPATGRRRMRSRYDFMVAARAFRPGDRGGTGSERWRWPAGNLRVVWGTARRAVFRRVVIADGHGTRIVRRPGLNGEFGVFLPAAAPDTHTTVTLVERSGRRIVHRLPGIWKGNR